MAIVYERFEISEEKRDLTKDERCLVQKLCRICDNVYSSKEVTQEEFQKQLENFPDLLYAQDGNTETLTGSGYCGCQDEE